MLGPRVSREALIAEMLGDLDTLVTRIETLPSTSAGAQDRAAGAVASLNGAGDKYRLAVTDSPKKQRLN